VVSFLQVAGGRLAGSSDRRTAVTAADRCFLFSTRAARGDGAGVVSSPKSGSGALPVISVLSSPETFRGA
jgi:hypothetical protein